MHPEIEKLVVAAKLTSTAGKKLDALQPGAFVQHKSWGFGRVASWDAVMGQMTIDFLAKKNHAMQFPFAAETLALVPDTHLMARKITDPASVAAMLKDDPRALVRLALESLGGRATALQLQQLLTPEITKDEATFKKWWEGAKRALKSDGHFLIPTKKTDPVELRAESVSRDDAMIARWNAARQSKEQVAALDEMVKNFAHLADAPAQLPPVIAAAGAAAARAQKLNLGAAIELLALSEELAAAAKITPPEPRLAAMLAEERTRLAQVLSPLGVVRDRQVLRHFPAAFGEEWAEAALALLPRAVGPRLAGEICTSLVEGGRGDALHAWLGKNLRSHTIPPETLHWVAEERKDWPASDYAGPELLGVIFSALERDAVADVKRGAKLREIVNADRELVSDLIAHAPSERVRGLARSLWMSSTFEDLTKKSLMARIIKAQPELQSILDGAVPAPGAQPETSDLGPVLVTWESLKKRRAEFDDLVHNLLPANVRDIATARSYGDLRENGEFKAAKQQQAVLGRRRAELEDMLQDAEGTDFADVDTSQVVPGTRVRVRDGAGVETTYAILGAWDNDPENHVIPYNVPIARALIHHKVGETAMLPAGSVEILEITRWNESAVPAEA